MTEPLLRITPARQWYIDALVSITYPGLLREVPLGELVLWVEHPACTWRVLHRGSTVAEGFVRHYKQVPPAMRQAVRAWAMNNTPTLTPIPK